MANVSLYLATYLLNCLPKFSPLETNKGNPLERNTTSMDDLESGFLSLMVDDIPQQLDVNSIRLGVQSYQHLPTSR